MTAPELITALATSVCMIPVVTAIVLGWALWFSAAESRRAGTIASLALAVCFGLTCWSTAIYAPATGPIEANELFVVARFIGEPFSLGVLVDPLALLMAVTVTFVATCVSIYATGYLSEDAAESVADHEVGERVGRYPWFFACLLAFVAAMLGLVFSPNLFQTFVFWELVGACSYFLIGFYKERPAAGRAATKAFVVNRIGDFGFLIGIMIFWCHAGTLTYSGLSDAVASGTQSIGGLTTAACLGIFAGCVGKSAQFPLQTWLPDAMAGPTPVSALVHSATMVAAGVYLVARSYALFTVDALMVVAYCGAVTLVLAALFALAADDIKRILAWSTVSQLGYMMLAMGAGGWDAGVLHLVTHAFFKSLLFLAAGSVIHACHHEQSLKQLGGLWRRQPLTASAATVGVVAICGLAFSGFVSKDAILAQSMAFAKANPPHALLFVVPLVGAGLTALYMGRFLFGIFAGSPRSPAAEAAQESPAHMWIPMGALVAVTIFGVFGGESGPLVNTIASAAPQVPSVSPDSVFDVSFPTLDDLHGVHSAAAFSAYLVSAGSLIAAWLAFSRRPTHEHGWLNWTPRLGKWLTSGGMADEIYDAIAVAPAKRTGHGLTNLDRLGIDRLVGWIASSAVRVAKWDDRVDKRFVDGTVNLLAAAVDRTATRFSQLQTGSLRQYVVLLSVGLLSAFALLFTFLPTQ